MSQSVSKLSSQSINETVSQQEKNRVNSSLVSQWVCDCLVPVRRFPSPSRSIRFSDVSETNGHGSRDLKRFGRKEKWCLETTQGLWVNEKSQPVNQSNSHSVSVSELKCINQSVN